MYASRNISLCTKDCLCLFVCPTGATNTETGQIDKEKCVEGCRACVDACPSHAIHFVMDTYPEPAAKAPEVAEKMMELCTRKAEEEAIAHAIAEEGTAPGLARIARAIERSCRILSEDCAREAGYLIPQCRPTRQLLSQVAKEGEGEPRAAAEELIRTGL